MWSKIIEDLGIGAAGGKGSGTSASFETDSSQILVVVHSISGSVVAAIQGSIDNTNFDSLTNDSILNGSNAVTSNGDSLVARAYPHMKFVNVGTGTAKADIYQMIGLEDN
tara:strand:- start:35 stop:364 length:330 start_codon:yes stop_codon:yes gene_type:complete